MRISLSAALAATVVSTGILLTSIGGAHATPAPGPDGFGYASMGIANNLRNVNGSGTQLIIGDDQMSGALAIGFNFNFYGTNYSMVHNSSNGFLDFDGGNNGCCSGSPLPSNDSTNNIIAGLWEDLRPPFGGSIWYDTLGAVGNREFVMGFYDIPHFFSGDPVTFEMILHEGTNDIELQYGALATGDTGTHTIGIEDATGTIGLEIFNGSGSSLSQFANTGILITHPGVQVPEPGTLALFGIGLAGLGFARRRKAIV